MWIVKKDDQFYVASYFTNDLHAAKTFSDRAIALEVAACYEGATVESKLGELTKAGYPYMQALNLI